MAVQVGDPAPNIPGSFTDAEGNKHDLSAELASGPVLLGLYKSSCQASKTFFPFLERLNDWYKDDGLTVLGVAQDSANITKSFARRLGLNFPILVEPDDFPIANAFDIAATPTIYLIGKDGKVAYTTMGFLKPGLDAMGNAVTAALGVQERPLVGEQDADVPMFVPG